MIDPGILNRRLVLEAPVEAADGQGGVTRSYAAVATLWASVMPSGAHATVQAAARGIDVTHHIVIRRNAAITAQHRLRDGANLFHIVGLREDATRQFLQIDAIRRID